MIVVTVIRNKMINHNKLFTFVLIRLFLIKEKNNIKKLRMSGLEYNYKLLNAFMSELLGI